MSMMLKKLSVRFFVRGMVYGVWWCMYGMVYGMYVWCVWCVCVCWLFPDGWLAGWTRLLGWLGASRLFTLLLPPLLSWAHVRARKWPSVTRHLDAS